MPAPNHYYPKEKITENLRFSKITFGKGNKIDFSKGADPDIPGPGYYRPYSVFDKF